MKLTRIFLGGFLLVLSCLPASLSAQSDLESRIRRVENGLLPPVLLHGHDGKNLLKEMKALKVPGVSIAVFYNNTIQWARGYGVMDNETREPVTEKTLFVAGSISKPVAVMGALRLVQDGKLFLDRDINDVLVTWKLPGNDLTRQQPVTLRELVSHSAGVTVHGFRGYAEGEPVPTIVQILDGLPPANSPPIRVDLLPGKQWRYSGGGLTIMQLAITDVAKEPFAEFMDHSVLKPIGMTSSSYDQSLAGERLKLAASGHDESGAVIAGKRFRYPEMAAAGLWTTPTDLARFAIEAGQEAQGNSSKVLNKQMASLMMTPQIRIDDGSEMALGFFLQHKDGEVYYGHGGQDVGFIAQLISNREGGYGAAIMTNSDGLSGRLIEEILKSIAKEYGWKGYLPKTLDVAALDREALEQYVGQYQIDSDDLFTVRRTEGRLIGKETGETEFAMFPISADTFVREDRVTRYTFSGIADHVANDMSMILPGETRSAMRAPEGMTVPLQLLNTGAVDRAMERYRALHTRNAQDPSVSEDRINRLGYSYLAQKKLEEAIALFRLNVEFYPASANAYDSLGEALAAKGETNEAIRNYERSLELDPKNTNGAARLKQLKMK